MEQTTMPSYACTQCMQWFDFEQLSKDKLMCSNCCVADPSSSKEALKNAKQSKSNKESKKRNVCKYCQTDLKSSGVCDRCFKNLKEHGKPKQCVYCKLRSAFIGSKCQRCSSSQKKYGPPVECRKCGSKSAFDHNKARINGLVLCWLCYVASQKNLRKLKRKHDETNDEEQKVMRYSPSQPYLFERTKEDLTSGMDQEDIWDQLDNQVSKDQVKEKKVENLPKVLQEQKSKKNEDLRKQAQLNYSRSRDQVKPGRKSLESRLSGMKKTFSAPNSPSGTLSPMQSMKKEEQTMSSGNTPKSDSENTLSWQANTRLRSEVNMEISSLPSVSDTNIVLVTKLRDEITSLKQQVAKKDQQLIEKDKQISVLKVEHLTEIRSIQTKLKNQEEEYIKHVESLRNKNQELLKKIAQISKGKA